MGSSSKKHKDKREKKKHKRERSRSRSRDRDAYRRSRKSKKERRERSDDDSKGYERKPLEGPSASPEEEPRPEKLANLSGRDSEDDLDIDQLLDSKLESEKPSKKTPRSRVVEGESKHSPSIRDDDEEKVISRSKEDSWLQKSDAKAEPMDQDNEEASGEDDGKVHLSLSINETNKLRAKLGLKPLAVSEEIPGLGDEEKPSDDKKNEVFVKTVNIADVKSAEKMREKIQVMKEKRKIVEKLSTVKPLGESDSEEESASAWVTKMRKIHEEKEKAEKRAKLLEEMDAEFGVAALVEEDFEPKKQKAYTSHDLRGLKVAHDSSMIGEGKQIILTLKDKGVLDEEEDVLQNVNLVDEERYAKNIENKKRKKDYQPYEEEYDEFGILKKKTILSKYDEEIHGEEKKNFTLGSSSQIDKEKEIEMIRMKLRQQQGVTLEMPNVKIASEYYSQDDMVQFKRPKKKKRLRRKILKADELLPYAEQEEQDGQDFGSRENSQNLWEPVHKTQNDAVMQDPDEDDIDVKEDLSKVVIEEDQAERELHSALHRVRKQKQRSALNAPEKIILESLAKAEGIKEESTEASKAGSIILNSTAEFCRTLGDIPTYGMSGNRDEEADELMDLERELLEERQRQELEAQNRGAWNEVNMDETPGEITMRENEPILEEEPDISLGVAGALKLAQKKGYLDKEMKKQLTGPRASQLQAKSYTIEEKFYEDEKFGKRDRCSGPIQDFREKSNYKPDVKLEYIDDSGRLLNAKEAFRYLSHKFHGKGPGKNKVDKRMKKLDQDTKLKQMSSTDTPLNTVKLLQAKQKETQSPYIVLSGGSKTLTQTMISKPKNP